MFSTLHFFMERVHSVQIQVLNLDISIILLNTDQNLRFFDT